MFGHSAGNVQVPLGRRQTEHFCGIKGVDWSGSFTCRMKMNKSWWFKEFCQHGPVWFGTLYSRNWVLFVGECDSMGFFIKKHWKRCIISRHLWIVELDSWGNWTTEIHDCVQLNPVALQFHWSLFPGGRLLSKRVGSLLDVYHMMTMNLAEMSPRTHI